MSTGKFALGLAVATLVGGSAGGLHGALDRPEASVIATPPAASVPSTDSSEARTAAPTPGTTAALLADLPIKGRSAMTGYDRERFGQAWLDADRNGCDTRNDVLGHSLSDVRFKAGTRGCVVLAGDLDDPYTGVRIHFVYGDGTLIDIDHVVALGNAWVTGAAQWPIEKRAALANDPLNLLAVDAGENRSKGDSDAASWLPPAKAFRCRYVARQVAVKVKYGLWITRSERAAFERILASCPDERPPADSGAPTEVDQDITDPRD